MTEETPKDAIYVPDEVAKAEAVPDDLDSDVDDLSYAVPDTNRRRIAGAVYLVGAVIVTGLLLAGLVPPAMWWTAAGVLAVVGTYHVVAGWSLVVRQREALEAANRAVAFPVGHASASLGFSGWRARPIWNVLVFSADEAPSQRGLVRVDGIGAAVVDSYVEDVPSV